MPTPRHRGQYDRVHVGASCPPDRLQPLVALLRPEGGLIVVPVSPNDLRVITKKPNGTVTQKVSVFQGRWEPGGAAEAGAAG